MSAPRQLSPRRGVHVRSRGAWSSRAVACAAIAWLSFVGPVGAAPTPDAGVEPAAPRATPQQPEPPEGFHGMLVLGSAEEIYFLHLAMRSPSPHQFQLVMKTRLVANADTAIGDRTFVGEEADLGETTAEAIYFDDRNHPENDVDLYTFQPRESFVLTEIPRNERTRFTGDIVRGHFELDADPPSVLRGVDVEVEEIVYFDDLRTPLAELHPREEGRLEFLLFGAGDEFFLSHRITLHGTQNESDDNAFHQVFRLSPTTASRLRFDVDRNAAHVVVPVEAGTTFGRLPEDGGTLEASLRGLVDGIDVALPLTLEIGPEHYLEVLF